MELLKLNAGVKIVHVVDQLDGKGGVLFDEQDGKSLLL